jgi:hypothetical protein
MSQLSGHAKGQAGGAAPATTSAQIAGIFLRSARPALRPRLHSELLKRDPPAPALRPRLYSELLKRGPGETRPGVIHRWGWTITRHPDGTTTATAPDGRTLHSHSPPQQAA